VWEKAERNFLILPRAQKFRCAPFLHSLSNVINVNFIKRKIIMPIYEFKCLKCEDFFELLVMNNDELELRCPECKSEDFERVLSTTNYAMGGEGGGGVGSQTRTCSSGSCTTYDIPGPTR